MDHLKTKVNIVRPKLIPRARGTIELEIDRRNLELDGLIRNLWVKSCHSTWHLRPLDRKIVGCTRVVWTWEAIFLPSTLSLFLPSWLLFQGNDHQGHWCSFVSSSDYPVFSGVEGRGSNAKDVNRIQVSTFEPARKQRPWFQGRQLFQALRRRRRLSSPTSNGKATAPTTPLLTIEDLAVVDSKQREERKGRRLASEELLGEGRHVTTTKF